MEVIETSGWDRFVQLFRGDMDAVRDVAQVFLQESRSQGEAIETAVAAEDALTLRRQAHSLQSTARQIGALELADVARTLEDAGKTGDMESARQVRPRFSKLLVQVQEELRRRLA